MIWDVDPVAFHIGSWSIRYYSMFVGLVLITLVYFWAWQTRRAGYPEQVQYNMLLWMFVGCTLGARVFEMVFYQHDKLLADPLVFFKIWKGGLSSHGVVAAFFIIAAAYGRHYKMGVLEAYDRSVFTGPVLIVMVRLGNFFNSEIVGRVTDLPWGFKFMRFRGDRGLGLDLPARHPVVLYEALVGLGILILLLLIDRKLKEKRPNGLLLGLTLTIYFSLRFFIEYTKEYLVFEHGSPIDMGQILSIPFFIVGVVLIALALAGKTGTPRPAEETRALFAKEQAKRKKAGK